MRSLLLAAGLAAAASAFAAVQPLSLNGTWEFRFEEGKSWKVAKADFVATDPIVVPGCFDAMPKWFMKRGTGHYRRTFTLDRAVENAWLVIDGLGLYGTFQIDGRDIGADALPWSRVELATGPLAAGTHTLFAAVDNRFDWSYQKLVRTYYDFHCWGGFFHGVSLVFDNRRFLVRTRDYTTGTVEIEAVNFAAADFDATLVFDGRTEVAASFRGGRATVRVPGFRLWSPDHPNLHTVAIRDAASKAPALATRFGIRTIEARNGGLYLNGERIFLKGANRHDQQLQLGAATPEGVMLADIQNLKAMGGNFFRGAHYPQAQRFLDLCDEHGVLVWEESLGWGNGQSYTYKRIDGNNELLDPGFVARQLEQTTLMVRNSFNHPSVIIFAFMNECNSGTPECKAVADQLIDAIRKEDSGRLVTFACNMISTDICNANTDIIAFNTYPGTINGYPGPHDELVEKIHNMKGHGVDWAVDHFQKKYPGKTIIISEMGTAGLYGHRDPSAPAESEDFQNEHNDIVARAVWNNPGLAGIAYWQYFDTRTCGRECAQDGKKHVAMSFAGLFDCNRRPKAVVRTLTDWFTNRRPANLGAR
ncbi:MAG: glycoside hydrolase family 2 protein [Kiritimatiellia bacterium]